MFQQSQTDDGFIASAMVLSASFPKAAVRLSMKWGLACVIELQRRIILPGISGLGQAISRPRPTDSVLQIEKVNAWLLFFFLPHIPLIRSSKGSFCDVNMLHLLLVSKKNFNVEFEDNTVEVMQTIEGRISSSLIRLETQKTQREEAQGEENRSIVQLP